MVDTFQVKIEPVVIKKGKEKAIRNRHHWIFSGAIQSLPDFKNGAILPVQSSEGLLLGSGYFNRKASIIGRMLTFNEEDPRKAIKENISKAHALRQILFSDSNTTAYRVINGEGDFLPGLVVDKYGDTLVLQISTLGMDLLRSYLLALLHEIFQPATIYEKSILPSRKEEGLADLQALHYGHALSDIEIKENALRFLVSPMEGQKTGFFLDHREMREEVRALSKERRVLNCFSYTGGFSVYAAAGGAEVVDSVDLSEKALDYASRNMALNGFSSDKQHFIAADVFQFLRQSPLSYDLVILDPPAFAKREKDLVQACRGYKDINRLAMQKMPPRSFLLTSSCSYHVNESLFQKVVFQASREAERSAKIISKHHLAPDHPINICHPESDYLKSLLLYIE